MQWVKSGDVSQRLTFLATTTGQAGSLTCYRKRGNGSWTAMTTPTFAEDDATHAPKVYSLLMDEDMTITAGKTTELMSFYIAGGTIAAVLVQVLLYENIDVNVVSINDSTVTGTGTSGDQWRGV